MDLGNGGWIRMELNEFRNRSEELMKGDLGNGDGAEKHRAREAPNGFRGNLERSLRRTCSGKTRCASRSDVESWI